MSVRASSGNKRIAALLVTLLLAPPASAQPAEPAPHPEPMPPHGGTDRADVGSRAARRFPQPVRVGTLIGRDLLRPEERQPVLGRVAGLVRRSDGSNALLVRLDGRFGLIWLGLRAVDWQGFGSRLVSVPVEAVALLGEFVALMDLSPERLQALPTFERGTAAEIAPTEVIAVGITRPFH